MYDVTECCLWGCKGRFLWTMLGKVAMWLSGRVAMLVVREGYYGDISMLILGVVTGVFREGCYIGCLVGLLWML